MSDADQELFAESRSRKSSASSSTGSSFEKLESVSAESNERADELNPEEVPVEDLDEASSEGKKEITQDDEEEKGHETAFDPLNASMKPHQEKFYQYEDKVTAIRLLVLFSAAMFTLPLLLMFSMYHYVFLDHYHLPPDQAMLYSAFFGVAAVVIIVAGFVYTAYKEEVEAERRKKKDS